jgi:hypothetical protein
VAIANLSGILPISGVAVETDTQASIGTVKKPLLVHPMRVMDKSNESIDNGLASRTMSYHHTLNMGTKA